MPAFALFAPDFLAWVSCLSPLCYLALQGCRWTPKKIPFGTNLIIIHWYTWHHCFARKALDSRVFAYIILVGNNANWLFKFLLHQIPSSFKCSSRDRSCMLYGQSCCTWFAPHGMIHHHLQAKSLLRRMAIEIWRLWVWTFLTPKSSSSALVAVDIQVAVGYPSLLFHLRQIKTNAEQTLRDVTSTLGGYTECKGVQTSCLFPQVEMVE